MEIDHSIWGLFMQASFIVKVVMLILIGASISAWTIIIQRAYFFNELKRSLIDFEEAFWSGKQINQLFVGLDSAKEKLIGIKRIFHSGFKEYSDIKTNPHMDISEKIRQIQRAMQVSEARETEKLQKHLGFLATVGSVTPYIGLFGTVWGIMNSFRALGSVQQASISMVAPGIAEALIATAMGLFAAIPAVIAYNRYSNTLNTMLDQFDMFQKEFISMIATRLSRQQEYK